MQSQFILVPRAKRKLRGFLRFICKGRNLSLRLPDFITSNKSVNLFYYKDRFTFSLCTLNCGVYTYGSGTTISEAAYYIFYELTTKYPHVLKYQGQRCTMSDNQIEQRLLRAAIDNGVSCTIPGANCRVRGLHTGADDVVVKSIVEEEVDAFNPDIRKKFIRTSDVTDVDCYIRGALVHHSEESKRPYLLSKRARAVAYIMFVLNNTPTDSHGNVSVSDIPEPPTCETPEDSVPEVWATIPVSDSSTGYLTGSSPKSKRENCHAAATQILTSYLTGIWTANVSMMAAKLEMCSTLLYKPEEKIRQIFVQMQKCFIILTCLFNSFLHSTGSIENGDAISAPTNGNYGSRLFMRMARPIGFNLKEAQRRGLFECDAKKWEATTKLPTVWDFLLWTTSMMSPTCLKYGCIFPGILTDILAPIIGISGEICMMKPGAIESGSKLTCFQNTMINKMYTHIYASYVMSHGGRIGKAECGCNECVIMSGSKEFGRKPKDLELRLLLSFVVLGDDFICIANGHTEAYIYFLDNVMGTKHEHDILKFEEGKFLQRCFKLDQDSEGNGYITTYRPTTRSISRLLGPGAHSLDKKIQQCISLAYECNNEDVTAVCRRVHNRLMEVRGHAGSLDDGINKQFDGVENYGGTFPTDEMIKANHAPDVDGMNRAQQNHELLMEYGTNSVQE